MDKIKVMDKMRKKKSLSLVNIAGILLFLCSIFWFMFEAEEEAGLSLLEVSKDDEGSLSITERTGRPEAVLFLSFPNSGTEFTLNTLKLATRTKSATNYKSESKSGKQLYPTIPNGPFLKDDKGTEIPKKYILTKTHCSGYSRDGSISSYIVNSEQFEKSCFSVMLNETTEVEYDSSVMPTKAIRLVRDPFDNIVSNYHHWLHNSLQNNDTLLEDYPSDRERFHEFCRRYDARFNELMDEEHVALFNHTRTTAMIVDVPCHQFFFRYVQWHNNANLIKFQEVFNFYFDDFELNYEKTLKNLADYLDLEIKTPMKDMPRFKNGKRYKPYFSGEEIYTVSQFIVHWADPETHGMLTSYI